MAEIGASQGRAHAKGSCMGHRYQIKQGSNRVTRTRKLLEHVSREQGLLFRNFGLIQLDAILAKDSRARGCSLVLDDRIYGGHSYAGVAEQRLGVLITVLGEGSPFVQ